MEDKKRINEINRYDDTISDKIKQYMQAIIVMNVYLVLRSVFFLYVYADEIDFYTNDIKHYFYDSLGIFVATIGISVWYLCIKKYHTYIDCDAKEDTKGKIFK